MLHSCLPFIFTRFWFVKSSREILRLFKILRVFHFLFYSFDISTLLVEKILYLTFPADTKSLTWHSRTFFLRNKVSVNTDAKLANPFEAPYFPTGDALRIMTSYEVRANQIFELIDEILHETYDTFPAQQEKSYCGKNRILSWRGAKGFQKFGHVKISILKVPFISNKISEIFSFENFDPTGICREKKFVSWENFPTAQ